MQQKPIVSSSLHPIAFIEQNRSVTVRYPIDLGCFMNVYMSVVIFQMLDKHFEWSSEEISAELNIS